MTVQALSQSLIRTDFEDWDTDQSQNLPSGQAIIGAYLDDNLRNMQSVIRQYLASKGDPITIGSTTDLSAIVGSYAETLPSTTSINIISLGNLKAGTEKYIKFNVTSGVPQIVHTGTAISIPGGEDINVTDGMIVHFISDGDGNWSVTSVYSGASGGGGGAEILDDLLDVTITGTPTEGSILQYQGGTWTNKSSVVQTIWIPAGAMITRPTTNGAAFNTIESTTNKVISATFDFDQSTNKYVQCTVRMPKGWNEGPVKAQFIWSSTVSSGAVLWDIQGVAIRHDSPIDTAFGTAIEVALPAVTAASDLIVSNKTTDITIAGTPQAEDYVIFQIYRNAADIADTLAGDARLHGITLYLVMDSIDDL